MTNETSPTTVEDAIAELEEAAKAFSPTANMPLWPNLTRLPESFSGTKGYVWADAYGDVREALRAIWSTCIERGLGVQAALPEVLNFPPDHPQAHKGVVITFPHRKTLDADIQAVAQALEQADYHYGAGRPVAGAVAIPLPLGPAGSLSTRFEHFLDMERDVDKYEHAILYRPSTPLMKREVEEAAKAIRAFNEGQQ